MPYITKLPRNGLDPLIDALVAKLYQPGYTAGEMNYVISRIVASAFTKEPSYQTIARITGVLENAKQEFYRRVAEPYEDDAAFRNGDIPEYKQAEKCRGKHNE